jgi:hypothetical protein
MHTVRAKSAKNDLKPTDLLERNFYFEREGVVCKRRMLLEHTNGKCHVFTF